MTATNPRILIIDDDENTRDILRRMLTRERYDVIEASDGKEGIRLFREQGADLVVTDILMPEKEGIETIIELHHEFPELKIIALSGGGELGGARTYLAAACELGASRSFEKPIPRREFLEAIRELVIKPGG